MKTGGASARRRRTSSPPGVPTRGDDGAPVEILAARDVGDGLELRLGNGAWVHAGLLTADGGQVVLLAAAR